MRARRMGRRMGPGFGPRRRGGARRGFPGRLRLLGRPVLRRRIIRRSPGLLLGAAGAIFLAGRLEQSVKISQNDLRRIEQDTGKPVEDLTEAELSAALERLNIHRLALTEEDVRLIEMTGAQPQLPANCSACGAATRPDHVEWAGKQQAFCRFCGSGLSAQS